MISTRTSSLRHALPRAHVPTTGAPEIDSLAVALLEHRHQLEVELVEWIVADPPLMAVHLEHVPDGRRIVDRDDLRLILCACDERHHDRLGAMRLAYRALQAARMVDDSMPANTRGLLWSWASLTDLWCFAYAGHGADVARLTRELVDIDQRLTDARDSYLYLLARLRGEA